MNTIEFVNATEPMLTILVALPAVASLAFLIPALRAKGRLVALVISLVELALALVTFIGFFDWSNAGTYQLVESYKWIPQLGVSWSLGVNALGAVMILLAVALVPVVLLAGWNEDATPEEGGSYAALVLILQTFMVAIFAAFDVVLFYFAFEAMLIPLYLMIGRYGIGDEVKRRAAAMKFLLFSLAGGLVMLGGIVALWAVTPWDLHIGEFFRLDVLAAQSSALPATIQMGVFITFIIAFAIKAPMVPLHTWLPDTAEVARPGTSVLLVGVLDKIGTFGMIALCLQLFPVASAQAATVMCVLAVISIIWGGLAAIGQNNILRLVSYTSVSHFGFMVLGTFIGSSLALTGAMVYMVAHGVSIAAMFILSGWLVARGGSANMNDYSGMQRVTPVLAGLWLIAGLASVALPGLSGFVPEYLVLMGTWKVSIPLAVVAVTGVVIAALYLLLPYQRVFTGTTEDREISGKKIADIADLGGREKFVAAPLVIAMIVLGVWSAPLVSSLDQVATGTVVTSTQGGN